MAMYATPTELAGYLQQDVDTYTATQALTLASGEFSGAAETWFEATTTTWSTLPYGCSVVELPFKPVTAVSQVRINGSVTTGWTLRQNALYRSAGFGYRHMFPPDEIAVDLTHGFTTVPGDVKLATLEIASGLYENPSGVASESIDDYRITYYNGKPILPGRPWREVAASYRGILVA